MIKRNHLGALLVLAIKLAGGYFAVAVFGSLTPLVDSYYYVEGRFLATENFRLHIVQWLATSVVAVGGHL